MRVRPTLVERMRPPEARATPPPLTEDQRSLLGTLERLGPRETFDRLHLAGPYEVIYRACQRLGSDAVAELGRMALERDAGGR